MRNSLEEAAIEDGVFGRRLIITFAQAGFCETQLFVERMG